MAPVHDPVTERILKRLSTLSRGPDYRSAERMLVQSPESEIWRVRVLTLLREVLPRDDLYRRRVENLFTRYMGGLSHMGDQDAVRTLKALRHDIMKEELRPIEGLVAARLQGDFLDQADYLHQAGYHAPAASLAGAVLEAALRQLAVSKGVPWEGRSSISQLNKLLQGANVYTAVVGGKVGLWNTVRNKADHMELESFRAKDVEEMLGGVRNFLSEQLRRA